MNNTTASTNSLMNCTPHAINLYRENELIQTILPSGYNVRVSQEPQLDLGKLILENGKEFPILSAPVFKNVEGLPENGEDKPKDIIVSMLVAQELSHAGWVGKIYTPDTSPAGVVRDDKGAIIGTKHLIRYDQIV